MLSRDTITRTWLPLTPLRHVVQSVTFRDTRSAVLTPADRFTYGSARVLCLLSWKKGSPSELLTTWAPDDVETPREPLPMPVMFAGGIDRPWATYAKGGECSLTVALWPDACRMLFGVDPESWRNRCECFAFPHVSEAWTQWAESILAADWDASIGIDLQTSLAGRIDRLIGRGSGIAHRPWTGKEWREALFARAVTGLGSATIRSLQRFSRRSTGFTPKEQHRLERLEEVAVSVARGLRPDRGRMSRIAGLFGFSDQSHLTRECKAATGFPPLEFYRRVLHDESFWAYRAYYGAYAGR